MHTGSTALAIELNALKIEHERLLEQSSHADAAIYQLTMEREDYKMRWLGSMTTRDAQLIRDENERLRGALTPSAETKAAYIGEFTMDLRQLDEFGVEQTARITIPWTSVKEIMHAIQKYADEQDASK